MIKIDTNKSISKITKDLSNMHALDIAKQIVDLDEEAKKLVTELIPFDKVDDVFIELSAEAAIAFFNDLDIVRQRILITNLSAFDLRPLFIEFDENEKVRFLNLLDKDKKNRLKKLLEYSETSAASVMDNEYLILNVNQTAGDAMRYIIDNVEDTSFIDILYVTDDLNKLKGLVYLKDLIIARKNDGIKTIIKDANYFVFETDTLIKAIKIIEDYDLNVIPVTDSYNSIIGIITADDILEEIVLESESKTDRFVAVGEYDAEDGPFKRSYKRLPWLLASIVLNLVIAMFLSLFSDTIDTVKALILFQPMILGMAGNIGTQSIAVTIVELHLKRQDTKEKRKRHIKKEALIGILNSALVGVGGFLLTYLFLSISNFDAAANIPPLYLSLSIGLSLFFAMMLSAFFGVGIPLLLDKLKVDPAAASGPIISTINDLVALLIYFGFATIMIQLIM